MLHPHARALQLITRQPLIRSTRAGSSANRKSSNWKIQPTGKSPHEFANPKFSKRKFSYQEHQLTENSADWKFS